MILLLGGTSETAPIADGLAYKGHDVLVSNCTNAPLDSGSNPKIRLRTGPLGPEDLSALIEDSGISAIVDATHPYAVRVSDTAVKVCRSRDIPYYRYQRPCIDIEKDCVHQVHDHNEAAEKAVSLGSVILLTTGSRNLTPYVEQARLSDCDIFARVLDCDDSIRLCLEAGIDNDHIISGRGPFSTDDNIKLIQKCGAEVLVTKESGSAGGLAEKLSAAEYCSCSVVLIKRPEERQNGAVYSSIDALLSSI